MRDLFFSRLFSVMFIAAIALLAKGGSFTAMASDSSSPTSFAIGPYKLDMSIVGLKGLVEIPPAEYKAELDRDHIEALKTLANDIVKFQKQQRYMQVMLYKEISEKLLKELTFEADVTYCLAAQIVNYYSGFDIDEQFRNMEEPNKSRVAKIRQWIIPKAEEMLKNNYNLRRLIVYALRMDIVYKFAMEGEIYLESDEKKRKESILIKFGAEFPEEANPKLFDKIFSDYFKVNF